MAECVKPTARQIEFQDWEMGMFMHFGIRTFYQGHKDWDHRPMPAEGFRPSHLDCNQWASVAKAAGFRYAVLTAKHHDGFANWPSKTTSYSVASSPWKAGAGDVIRDYVEAFRRQGLAVGLYYSPAQWKSELFTEDAKSYDEFFITQITELLQPYGPIDLLWFDGCGSDGHVYDWDRIVGEIRRMQPNLLIFNMGDPDMRWVGNEEGFAPSPVWNVIDLKDVPGDPNRKGEGRKWLPVECDCRLRGYSWFFDETDEDTIKSLDVLMGMYYCSVGRGCNLLINVAPDRRGLIPEKDAARLQEFGDEIRRRFARPIATLADFKEIEPNCWQYEGGLFDADHVVVAEDITYGEHVRKFRVEFPIPPGITLCEGQNIGHKAICQFPLVRRNRLRFRVIEADGPARLKRLEIHDSRRRR